MDFKDSIRQLAERAARMKDQIATEEATKTAIIMPFIQILGYDVFNPSEVVPEFIADAGMKKSEKVDYALYKNGIIDPKNKALYMIKDNMPVPNVPFFDLENPDYNITDISRYYNIS